MKKAKIHMADGGDIVIELFELLKSHILSLFPAFATVIAGLFVIVTVSSLLPQLAIPATVNLN